MKFFGCLLLIIFSYKNNNNKELLNAYENLEREWMNGVSLTEYNNLSGFFAWDQSYLLSSYLVMYESTNDVDYLQKVAFHVENIIDERDDVANRIDYRNISGATWVSTKYSNNRPYAWIVHSGMITYPMIKFAYLIQQDKSLSYLKAESCDKIFANKSFEHISLFLIEEVEKTVLAHDDQWDEGSGAYRFRRDKLAKMYFGHAGEILPKNQQSAIGRTLIYLYLTTGNEEYYKKANKIAVHIKTRFFDSNNYSYYWTYSDERNFGEDISHAALNVGFAYECYKNGIVFTEEDLIRISNTIRYNIFKTPNKTSRNVDGTGSFNEYQLQLGRWLYLAEVDPNLSHLVLNLFSDLIKNDKTIEVDNGETLGSVMLGLALLIKYYNASDTYSNYFNIYPNPTKGRIKIEFNRIFISPVQVDIIDINGKTIHSTTYQGIGENSEIYIPDLNIKNGLYKIIITVNGKRFSKKIIKN